MLRSLGVLLVMSAICGQAWSQSLRLAQGSTGGSVGNSGQELSGGGAKKGPAQIAPKLNNNSNAGQRAPAARGSRTFQNPTLDGHRVNWCYNNVLDSRCGDFAATAWCRSKGWTRATGYQYEVISSAIALGDRGMCGAFCGAFTVVTCE